MQPFNPWARRDPAALAGGYDQAGPDRGPAAGPSDAPGFSAAEADRGEIDLAGYRVEATDGRVGTVSEAGAETGARWLVVDTEYDPANFADADYRARVGAYWS